MTHRPISFPAAVSASGAYCGVWTWYKVCAAYGWDATVSFWGICLPGYAARVSKTCGQAKTSAEQNSTKSSPTTLFGNQTDDEGERARSKGVHQKGRIECHGVSRKSASAAPQAATRVWP